MSVFLVCGGRDYVDRKRMFDALSDRDVTAIVHGCAKGADTIAGDWAKANGKPEIRVPANWNFHKRAAGPKRNGWMLRFVRVDCVLAFPGGTGTANMVEQAKAAGVPVKEFA